MLEFIKTIMDFFLRLFGLANNNPLDDKIQDKKQEIGRIENDPRKVDDIINDLNKPK